MLSALNTVHQPLTCASVHPLAVVKTASLSAPGAPALTKPTRMNAGSFGPLFARAYKTLLPGCTAKRFMSMHVAQFGPPIQAPPGLMYSLRILSGETK